MGARSMPHPAPGPGAARGSIAAGPAGLSVGLDDPEPVPRLEVGALRALEDVADAWPGQEETTGPKRTHVPDDEIPIEHRDRDRQAHPERMDRPRPLEEQTLVVVYRGAIEEPAHPFTPDLGHERSENQTARADQPNLSHGPTVSPPEDGPVLCIGGPYRRVANCPSRSQATAWVGGCGGSAGYLNFIGGISSLAAKP